MGDQLLDKALIFAINAHSGMTRKGTDLPYIIHPMEAVTIVASITDDREIIAAAALHDVVKDTEHSLDEIREEFDDRIAELAPLATSCQIFAQSIGIT